jgi:RNA polymerase sigma factor (sigma-70 family)
MTAVQAMAAPSEELAARAGAGDREAFAALYERHFPDLYDFARRVVRDPDTAADVVQTTFTRAWQALGRGQRVDNVRGWLLVIARNAALDELRRRRRELPASDEEGGLLAVADESRGGDAAATVEDRELAALVWSAAEMLGVEDYALLDLHVRRELTADELAESLGVRKGTIYTRLSRLRDTFEEAVVALLLLQRGRRDCAVLDATLTELRATQPTPEVRRAIRNHLRDCERCEESRARLVSPVKLLGGLALVPAPAGVREEVWDEIAAGVGADGGTGAGGRGGGRGRRLAAVGVGLALLGGAGTAAGLYLSSGGPVRPVDPSDVHSTSHRLGVASTNPVVAIAWTPVPGADGYSVRFSHHARDLPDVVEDVAGSSGATRSRALSPGRWHFHLRTRNGEGRWTSTVHLGPFLLVARPAPTPPRVEPSPPPKPKPKPRPKVTPTPVPPATPATTPEPQPAPVTTREPTPAPQPVPQPAPKPKPKPKPKPTQPSKEPPPPPPPSPPPPPPQPPPAPAPPPPPPLPPPAEPPPLAEPPPAPPPPAEPPPAEPPPPQPPPPHPPGPPP